MEIAPGIHRIACPFYETRVVYVHLLVGGEHNLLVDTGLRHSPEQTIFPYMRQIGFDPAQLTEVLITHSDIDHLEGNELIRTAAPEARFLCHPADRDYIERLDKLHNGRYRQWAREHGIGQPPGDEPDAYPITTAIDSVVGEGDTLRLGPNLELEFIHTPGHTPGHLSVYERGTRTLIAGDSVLWTSIPDRDGQPLLPPTYAHISSYLATIARLRAMSIDLYSSGHWSLMRGKEITRFLDESHDFVVDTGERVLSILNAAKSGMTLREVISAIRQNWGDWVSDREDLLAFPIYGHLIDLEERGVLRRIRNPDGFVCWRVERHDSDQH